MKRASSSEWNRTKDTGSAWNGYLLREAEFGVEVFPDNKVKIKIGNGMDVWKDLPYITGDVGIFVTSLPTVEQAETKTFYVMGDKIYYTLDNKTWNVIGNPEIEFNDIKNRPKYNGSQMTSSTNIPKVPTTASELPYKNNNSGLVALDTQNAIDELNNKLKNTITKTNTPNTVYGNDSAGKLKMFPFSTAKVKDTIAQRTNAGTLKGAEPIEADDLTTKNYVDTNLQPIKSDIININSDISALDTRVTNVENRMTTAEGKISKNTTDISDLKNKVQTNTNNITNMQSSIQTINNQITTINNDITNIQNQISNDTNKITSIESTLNQEITDRQNQNVVSIKGGQGSDQTQLVLEKQDGTKLLGSIPLVSSTKNGLMTSAAFNQITANKNDIATLKNQGGHYIGRSFSTKAALDAYTIPSSVKLYDWTFVQDDETHNGALTKYLFDGTNFIYTYTIENDPIAIATKTKAGIVLSSDAKGQISVDVNGIMRLNGYDDIITDISGKVDKVSGKGLSTNDYTNDDKAKVDLIKKDDDGSKFLGDDGQYHEILIPDDKVQNIRVDGVSIIDSDGNVDLDPIVLTGSYNDLKDVPTDLVRDANYVHTDNNYTNTDKSKVNLIQTSGDGNSVLNNQGGYTKLHTIATTGSYNDLGDVPANLVQDSNYVHTDLNFTQTIYDYIFNDLDPSGEENKIESISLNGTTLDIDASKNVDIDLSDYELIADLEGDIEDYLTKTNVVKDANYVHTDNNFTNASVTKLNGIEENAEKNIIEIIKVDNKALPVNSSDRSVNIGLAGFATNDSVEDLEERVEANEKNIQSLKVSGLWRGIFDTKADLDAALLTDFLGGNVYQNDFVIVREDETHDGAKTRYYCTSTNEGLLGDINQDGIIDQTDVDLCRNSNLGTVTLTSEQIKLGDIDEDGTISLNDMVLIEDYINEPDKSQYIGKVGTKITTQITWMYFDEEEGNIDIASNTSLGLVKGTAYNSTTKAGFGKVSVDSTTGEMTVNGLDTLEYIPLAGTEPITLFNSTTDLTLPSHKDGKPVTGMIQIADDVGGISGIMGRSDNYRIMGRSTGNDLGYLEIATSDNGSEPIYIRQYNLDTNDRMSRKDFLAGDTTKNGVIRTATVLDENGDTLLPQNLTVSEENNTRIVMGSGSINSGIEDQYSWIDHRKKDNTLINSLGFDNEGMIMALKGIIGLGSSDVSKKGNTEVVDNKKYLKPRSKMQWNEDEDCIEFVFT